MSAFHVVKHPNNEPLAHIQQFLLVKHRNRIWGIILRESVLFVNSGYFSIPDFVRKISKYPSVKVNESRNEARVTRTISIIYFMSTWIKPCIYRFNVSRSHFKLTSSTRHDCANKKGSCTIPFQSSLIIITEDNMKYYIWIKTGCLKVIHC